MGSGQAIAVRDAATVIVVREAGGRNPSLLMGQRGRSAVFMPGKFVFPGGAVDPADAEVRLPRPLGAPCAKRLGPAAGPITAAALRELHEETGLALASPGQWQPPAGWEGFAPPGHVPDAGRMRYVFRAITPPGRPRRFDARFLIVPAEALAGDLDDFSAASDELSHLQWVPLAEARRLELAFITEVVLAEVAGLLPMLDAPASVPFFDNSGAESRFSRIA